MANLPTPKSHRLLNHCQMLGACGARQAASSSASRMNMNSRGCHPTEQCPQKIPTLNGSHRVSCAPSGRIEFSKPIPWVVPTAIQVVHLRRTDAWARGFGFGRWMWAVECWVLDLRCLRFPRSIFWISVEPMRRPEQFRPPVARRDARLPSATRMNMNSRGCQPTEQRPRNNPTLDGSHRVSCAPSGRTGFLTRLPWVTPAAIHVVRLQRTRPDRWRLEPVPAFVIGPERAVPS